MSKNKKAAKGKQAAGKKSLLPLLCAAVVAVAAASVLLPKWTASKSTDTPSTHTAAAGSDVEIIADTLGSTASFYDYDADGTTVQLFALKDADGAVRLALNTCQVCNGSPYAYFVQEGDSFICQNCLNRFSASEIGVVSGGCNPVPITEDIYTVEDGRILIPSSFLEENAARFTNWKKF